MRSFRSRMKQAWLVAVRLAVVAAAVAAPWWAEAQTIPSDAKPGDASCAVGQTEFAGWFQSGTPALNGVVNPANSVTFSALPNCAFYKWSEQMFLWLTSPTPPEYGGGGGRIFDAPKFFDVSPVDATGHRSLIPHSLGPGRFLGVRSAQFGPHGLPVMFAKDGRMVEVEDAPLGPSGKPVIKIASGRLLEISRIEVKEGKATFFSLAGKRISAVRPFLQTRIARAPLSSVRANAKPALIVQRFTIGHLPIFLDPFGNVVEVEQGEAQTHVVLMTQGGSLVYYGIHVNDVYAYFLTGRAGGQITPANTFPTTQGDLDKINAFAGAHGVTFPDPDALAIEVKTAWVEASKLPDASGYVTRLATVPDYTQSNSLWKLSGQKTVLLALVGMHVVGSTALHPEMIWATFEHLGNTPNDTYKYKNGSSVAPTVPRTTAGNWLFSASNSSGPFNVPHMFETPAGDIQAASGFTVSASDTIRSKAWGGAFDQAPNPIDQSNPGSSEDSNAEVILLNSSVRQPGLMPTGDVRGNYILTGATWTIPGDPPDGSGSFFSGGDEVGTSKMANTTLETIDQGTTAAASGLNCFGCHNGNMLGTPDGFGLSHIFGQILPLATNQLLVHVSPLAVIGGLHQIQVTVTNSATGKGVAGATVNVFDSNGGGLKAHGTTAAGGTVTLKYMRCIDVIDPGELPRPIHKPIVIPVPCDGNVELAEFTGVGFSAP